MEVTREQALRFRIASQGLGREGPADAVPDDDAGLRSVLDLGLQHHGHAVALALAARRGEPGDGALAWTHRGAPYRHEGGSLRAWAAALRPLGDDDAAARLTWSAPDVERIGIAPLAAIDVVAAALAEVVTAPMTKGEVSGALHGVLPRALQYDCAGCGAVHVVDQLLRLAAAPAGVGLVVSRRVLRATPPPPGWERPTGPGSPEAAARLVTAAVRVLGPVSSSDLAAWVGTAATALRPAVEAAELAAVTVAGRRAWVTADALEALADPPPPPGLRLLPPFDPLLAARDRALLVPDRERRRVLWPALGHPGAVLAGGEVVGTWRPAASGKRLTLAVTASDDVPRPALDDEAERVAAARGLRLTGVTVDA